MRSRLTHEQMMEMFDRGWDVFEHQIKGRLTRDDEGRNIVIDIDSGDWAIGNDARAVLESRNKNARTIDFHYSPDKVTAVRATESHFDVGGSEA